MGPLGIFCHFKQVFCRNGLPRLAVGLGSHYQVPSRAGIISWSAHWSPLLFMFIGAHCSPLESNAHKLDQHWLLALTIEDNLKQMEPIGAHPSLLEPFEVC